MNPRTAAAAAVTPDAAGAARPGIVVSMTNYITTIVTLFVNPRENAREGFEEGHRDHALRNEELEGRLELKLT